MIGPSAEAFAVPGFSAVTNLGAMAIAREATGFGAVADAYEHGRPTYPAEAVSRLVHVLEIGPQRRVVDVAAGTGKLSRFLVPTGASVVGVEPVRAMQEEFVRAVPGAALVAGTAEGLPLATHSVDALTVAQAFHWFRGGEALAEASRVLRPGGGLALLWNVRDTEDPLQRAIEEVMAPYRGNSPSPASGAWRSYFPAPGRFGPLVYESFSFEQRVSRDQLVARVVSVSFIGCLPPTQRQRVADQVAALAPADGVISLHYRTDLYWCTSGRS